MVSKFNMWWMAQNFVYGIILAILFGIVYAGIQLIALGNKKENKNDALALKITGYALIGLELIFFLL